MPREPAPSFTERLDIIRGLCDHVLEVLTSIYELEILRSPLWAPIPELSGYSCVSTRHPVHRRSHGSRGRDLSKVQAAVSRPFLSMRDAFVSLPPYRRCGRAQGGASLPYHRKLPG